MSSGVATRRWRLAVRLTAGALVWAIGVLLTALLVPAFDGQTVSSSNGVTLTTATFVQVNGAWGPDSGCPAGGRIGDRLVPEPSESRRAASPSLGGT